MTAIVDAVTESTRLSREAAPDTWLDRFRVLDQDPALSAETAEHWRIWAEVVAHYVERRRGLASGSIIPAAIGGAVQAAYVAVLRRWVSEADEVDLSSLRTDLVPLGSALEALLDAAP
jgi:hypothetical protein